MNQPMIDIQGLSFRYPEGNEALHNIDLSIQQGERIAVLGSNGSGKSTLFLMLNGLLKPDSGCYCFDGKKINYKKADLTALRKRVAVVMQDPDSQFFAHTVYGELSFGPLNMGLSRNNAAQRVEEVSQRLNLANLLTRQPQLLSFGQKKRVLTGAFLSMKPDVLVLDEPFAGLDPQHATNFRELLDRLHNEGMTIIQSTHDTGYALEWADRVIILHEGKIMEAGHPTVILNNEAMLQSFGLNRPTVLDIYAGLPLHLQTYSAPRNVEELKQIISSI
jgi:cobalt/nickel transport system ATP-binding protein